MEIKKVGVVGCGTMGGGIAQVSAQAGYDVVVSEINDELLQKGLASIKSALSKSVQKEKITPQEMEATLAQERSSHNPRNSSAARPAVMRGGAASRLRKVMGIFRRANSRIISSLPAGFST